MILAAELSLLKFSSSLSLIILVSNLAIWKLNTLCPPLSISISTRKFWQALGSSLRFSPSFPSSSTILFKSATVSLGFRCFAPCSFLRFFEENSNMELLFTRRTNRWLLQNWRCKLLGHMKVNFLLIVNRILSIRTRKNSFSTFFLMSSYMLANIHKSTVSTL